MSDLTILAIFLCGAAFGIIATLIYWPWVEPKVMGYGKEGETE